MQENSVINTKNKSHSVTAEIEIPSSGGAKGVIAAHGGHMGGWALYVHKGKLKYHYNFLGLLRFEVGADSALPAGKHQVRMEFTYDGGGLGKGAGIALYVDGAKVGEGRVARTHGGFAARALHCPMAGANSRRACEQRDRACQSAPFRHLRSVCSSDFC